MGQSSHGIDAGMRFHAEVILLAFLGLLHLRVALLGLVLGGRGDRHSGTLSMAKSIAQRLAVVDGILQRLVGKGIPLLEK